MKKPSETFLYQGRDVGDCFQQMGKNVLFAVPTNRLDVEPTTYNKFFSIAVHEDVGERLPEFDY